MGNVFDSAPQAYSDQTKYGQQSHMYGGDYEAAYRQNSATADSIAYGNGRLQFGVKMLEDIDPGPMQGQMYVNDVNGKRVYFTYKGQLYPDARQRISEGKNYGNGPAISITGSPVNPKYTMFYSQGGDEHKKGDQWTPININSKKDIMEAMTSGNSGRDITSGPHSNQYGQSSINPFGAKEGDDEWTSAVHFDDALTGIVSQLVVPVGEMFLDSVVPFSSQVLGTLGVNKALQAGIDSAVKNEGRRYQGSSSFDPQISNAIKDPRLPGFLTNIQDQSHAFVKKYGPQKYVQTNKLAQTTPSQQIAKAKQLQAENEDLYVQGQVQKLKDISSQLQKIIPNSPLYAQINTGLAMDANNEQRMNIISHFSKQIQQQLLPHINDQQGSSGEPGDSNVATPVSSAQPTASAQVGHPSLSINGTDTGHPGKTTISGNPHFVGPIVPM